MHDFKFIRDNFYCEGVEARKLVERFGSPLYIYSHNTILDHYHKIDSAFNEFNPLICYSLKANSNLALAKILVKEGSGLDIVSGGELVKALKTGVDPKRIVYASVGKTQAEIRPAIEAGILFFNVESESELRAINRVAYQLNRRAQVAIRINPDIEPKTHDYITTGKLTNKFGLSLDEALKVFLKRQSFSHIEINGIHMHIGSQIINRGPFIGALKRVVKFIRKLKRLGIKLEYLNIGGGLGIIYNKERPQTADQFAQNVSPLLKASGLKIILEPGRFIVGNAGILATRVIYVKKNKYKTFVIVDAGMNDLIRPALYDAYHQIVPLKREAARKKYIVDVVGPICESGDFLAQHRRIPVVREGEYLAVMGAGAYGFSMASNYNCRLRPAEVLVKGNKAYLIRERENFSDLFKNERVPDFLK